MAIKKNETDTIKEDLTPKVNRSLLSTTKEEKKVGRKAFDDENLKVSERNTFLLNIYQQEKMEKRMKEIGIRSKTDYILTLLKKDIIDF